MNEQAPVIYIRDEIDCGILLSSIVLSSWITNNKNLFKNKRVVELSSGLGLCGLTVLTCCQPRGLRFTDCDTTLFNELKANIEKNAKNIRVIPNIQTYAFNNQGGCDVIIASNYLYHNPIDILVNAIFSNLNIGGTFVMSISPEWNRSGCDELECALKDHGHVIIERTQLKDNKGEKPIWVIVFTRTC
jgi:predicted nicotinamide N-methyase